MTYYKKSICSNDCTAACGLLIETDGKKIYSIKGDESHPLYHGLMCHKMRNHQLAVHSKTRISTPLKRVGKKGEVKFKEVSWDEAILDITQHFKEVIDLYGPSSIVPLLSAGNMGIVQRTIVQAFFNKMNASELGGTFCNGSKSAGNNVVTGGSGSISPLQMKNSDYVIVWGSNFPATLIHSVPIIQELRKKGIKIVVIEVCALDTAKYADELLLIKPGSDSALALALMHVLYKENLIDYDFLKRYVKGYAEFLETLRYYTPKWAENMTGISEEIIIRIAREYGRAKAPCILHGNGNTRRKAGGMNARNITILSFITGAWKNGGGYIGRSVKSGPCVNTSLINQPTLRKKAGIKEDMNLLSLILNDENRNPQVKVLFVSGSNPVNSCSDQIGLMKGLKREDLFTVVHEREMTDTAKYADYVLPATYIQEHSDCFISVYYPIFNTAYKIIEPYKECKSNRELISLFAREMGYEEDMFYKTDEELIDLLLDHPLHPLDKITKQQKEILKNGGSIELLPQESLTFKTKSQKLEILNEELEYPLPTFINDIKDGLCLIAVPSMYSNNSVFNFREDLIEKRGPMVIYINPEDAKKRNLKDNDLVEVYNDLASVSFTLHVTELVSKGAACVLGIYDSNSSSQLLQSNALNHPILADMGGSTLNGNYVEIRKRENQF